MAVRRQFHPFRCRRRLCAGRRQCRIHRLRDLQFGGIRHPPWRHTADPRHEPDRASPHRARTAIHSFSTWRRRASRGTRSCATAARAWSCPRAWRPTPRANSRAIPMRRASSPRLAERSSATRAQHLAGVADMLGGALTGMRLSLRAGRPGAWRYQGRAFRHGHRSDNLRGRSRFQRTDRNLSRQLCMRSRGRCRPAARNGRNAASAK